MLKSTPEEKLLKAIFGDEEAPPLKCTKCGRELGDDAIWYEGKPYHPYCLPLSGIE